MTPMHPVRWSVPPTFTLRESSGKVVCEWTPDPELWIDMQAFAAASGRPLEDILRQALTEFLIGR